MPNITLDQIDVHNIYVRGKATVDELTLKQDLTLTNGTITILGNDDREMLMTPTEVLITDSNDRAKLTPGGLLFTKVVTSQFGIEQEIPGPSIVVAANGDDTIHSVIGDFNTLKGNAVGNESYGPELLITVLNPKPTRVSFEGLEVDPSITNPTQLVDKNLQIKSVNLITGRIVVGIAP